jgi:glycosyltransferase involved in cell wall biosynthesis
MPHSIQFPRPALGRRQLRGIFGLPAEAFVFLSLLDLNSTAARKNPQASIAAFRQSGLGPDRALLVMKIQNGAANPVEFAALAEAAGATPGVMMIAETSSRAEIYALEAACDCLVSLHRAEGFGLAVAECMYLGKPAISTDWSATAEYVGAGNGCPVRARPVPIEENVGPYGRGSTWAEADVAQAAQWMCALAGDPSLAARLGAAARATIEERFAPATVGARYRRRLEAIAAF